MLKTHTCPHCGYVFTGGISYDDLGWHTACPECHGSFDVEFDANEDILKAQRDRYLELGNQKLQEASRFLHRNFFSWGSTYARIWEDMMRQSEHYLLKAAVLCDLIDHGRVYE